MEPSDADHNTIGVEYCTGYVTLGGEWKQGFYCPPKADGLALGSKDLFCCGSSHTKYCCSEKHGSTAQSTSRFYISISSLAAVVTVTFVGAVILTALTFLCCRKYWKGRGGDGGCGGRRNLEIHETHFYRMACSSSSAPLVATSFSSTSFPNPSSSLTSPLSPASLPIQTYPLAVHQNHHQHRRQQPLQISSALALIEPPGYPPPPYQSEPPPIRSVLPPRAPHLPQPPHPRDENNALVTRNETIKDNKRAKRPLWRTLSQ